MSIERFDVLAYFQMKGVEYNTEGKNVSEGWVEVKCPWCDDPSTHLGINLDSKGFNCWRCHAKGSFPILLRALENCSYDELDYVIDRYSNYSNRNVGPVRKRIVNRMEILDMEKNMAAFTSFSMPEEIHPLMRDFLKRRGLSPWKTIRKWDLRWGGIAGDWKFRIIIPVKLEGRIVTYTGRITGDHISDGEWLDRSGSRRRAKNRYSYKAQRAKDAAISIKSCLYNIDSVRKDKPAVVVEGPTDVWKLEGSSVATFGTKWTKTQLSLLKEKGPSEVFILYDSEPDAQLQARRFREALGCFIPTEVVQLGDRGDPGELTLEEGREVMKKLCH